MSYLVLLALGIAVSPSDLLMHSVLSLLPSELFLVMLSVLGPLVKQIYCK